MHRIPFLLLIVIITACAPLNAPARPDRTDGGFTLPVLSRAAQGSPADVVNRFLNHWAAREYAPMYDLLAEQSRARIAAPVFAALYEQADRATGMTSLEFIINQIDIQGGSAAVNYDLTMISPQFESITDAGRIMRLIQGQGGWRVAWSSMDIFDGLAGGAQIRSVALRGERANIYDRDGQGLVESNATVVALYIRQQETPNREGCLTLLAELLRRQREDLVTRFGRMNADTIFYVGEIDPDVFSAREAELRDTCAIRSLERTTRRYYRGNAVSHVTGYIGQIPADRLQEWLDRGYAEGDLVGRNGIEQTFNDELAGQAERVLRITEPGGGVIRELGASSGRPPQPLTLTIDRELQAEVSQALADAFNYAEPNWGTREISRGGAVVVVDVNTGAILAMSSYPLFEPDIFNIDTFCCQPTSPAERIGELFSDNVRTPMFNRAVQGQYPPGSVYKIVTMAAAAQERVFTRNDTFYCDLTWDGRALGDTVGYARQDWRFREEEPEPAGDVTMMGALTASCNPFFWEMGALLYNNRDAATLARYARQMGLGRPTGIDYYGTEAAGEIPVPNSVSVAINDAIGQGDVKVTPIQMAMLTASIANGGTLYKPYLVQRVGGLDNTPITFEAEPQVVGDIGLSPDVIAAVQEGMCDITQNPVLGTAVWPFEETPYIACGKTGTAETGRYPMAWFVAYVPAENPQVAIAVMVDQALEGSQVGAPIARRIFDFYMGAPFWGYPPFWNQGPYQPLTPIRGVEAS